jgi:hypothetical protein
MADVLLLLLLLSSYRLINFRLTLVFAFTL